MSILRDKILTFQYLTHQLLTRTVMDYHHQYAFDDGDIVLRSSDNINFRVHGIVLKTASTVFSGMIDMPRPKTLDDAGNEVEAAVETIPLAETALVLSFTLHSVYPHVDLPTITSFVDAHAIADAADKYEMPRVRMILRVAVLANASLRNETLRLYHLAMKCEWEDVIASSSERTLSWNLMTGTSSVASLKYERRGLKEHAEWLSELTATELWKLMRLHLTWKRGLLGGFDEESLTKFEAHRDDDCTWWFCPCGGSVEGAEVEEAFLAFRNAIAAYLERVPNGSALSDSSPKGRRPEPQFDLETAATAYYVGALRCPECKKPHFHLGKTIRTFESIKRGLPKSVLDLPAE